MGQTRLPVGQHRVACSFGQFSFDAMRHLYLYGKSLHYITVRIKRNGLH